MSCWNMARQKAQRKSRSICKSTNHQGFSNLGMKLVLVNDSQTLALPNWTPEISAKHLKEPPYLRLWFMLKDDQCQVQMCWIYLHKMRKTCQGRTSSVGIVHGSLLFWPKNEWTEFEFAPPRLSQFCPCMNGPFYRMRNFKFVFVAWLWILWVILLQRVSCVLVPLVLPKWL